MLQTFRVGLIPLVLLPSSGCTHLTTVSGSSPSTLYQEITRSLAQKNSELLLRDGQVLRWYDVHVSEELATGVPVGATLSPQGTWQRIQLKTDQVHQMEVRSRAKGALQGAGCGAAIGLLAGLWALSDDGEDGGVISKEQVAVTVVLWGSNMGCDHRGDTNCSVQDPFPLRGDIGNSKLPSAGQHPYPFEPKTARKQGKGFL